MDRRVALALVVYVVLIGSLATPLYDPLADGRDDSWALVVLLGGVHLGVGLVVRRAWVLLLPIGFAAAAFVFAGATGLAWLGLLLELPVLVGVTALGWLLGRGLARRATPVAVTAFLVAALPGLWAASATAQREPHVSAGEQRELPAMAYSLIQDLCFKGDSRFDRTHAQDAHARARRQFAAIARGLRAHPHAVVSVRFVLARSPGTQTREMTIRELAETHLEGAELDGPPQDTACYRSGRAKLQRLLDETD